MVTDKLLRSNRPLIMGILNRTPDSFSDGGLYQDEAQALAHALKMVEEGADIIDVGGESTRPGSWRIEVGEQIRRVVPIIERLRGSLPAAIPISIDTTRAEVAAAALAAGASILNDISAGRDDPAMFKLAAQTGAPIILMHMQATPETMQINPAYGDVVAEVKSFLLERAEAAQAASIRREQVFIDPGIGFGKTNEHNLALMANLKQFVDTGYPVLLGTSRKRFMGAICAQTEPKELLGATCATTALGVMAGVRIFRVHDIKANRQAADVAWTIHHLLPHPPP
jgi:dihydropteroate synthase